MRNYVGLTPNGVWVGGNLTVLTFKLQEVEPGHYISDEPGFTFKHWVQPDSVSLVERSHDLAIMRGVLCGFNTQQILGMIKQREQK